MELGSDVFGAQVGVSKQHAEISMTTDEGDLRHGQAQLEEPANCFVAQIVEMQIVDPGPFGKTLP